MSAQLFMATMIVLSGGIPGAAGGFVDGASDVVHGVVDGAIGIAEGVGNAANDAIDTVNTYGKAAGNLLEGIRETPNDGPILGGDPQDYNDERYLVNDSIDELEETLNSRESVWMAMNKSVIRGNITDNEVINAIPITEDSVAIGANYTAHVNWSNVTVEEGSPTIHGDVVEFESGLANDSDLTVYPKVTDIAYGKEHYQNITNQNTRAEVGSELWERVDNMRCEPLGKCNDLKQVYQDELVFKVIGGLSR